MDDQARRLLADAVQEVERGGPPVTEKDRAAALALATDMVEAAERHGVTYADFQWVSSLPAMCLDLVLLRKRTR